VKRRQEQEKCKENCMKDSGVVDLLLELDRFTDFNIGWDVGWVLTCLASFTLGPIGAILCAAVSIYAIYEYDRYTGILMDKLTEKGCLCALG